MDAPIHESPVATPAPEEIRINLDAQIKKGDMVRVERDRLMPSAAAEPLLQKKDASGEFLPVYVSVGLNQEVGASPAAYEVKDDQGKPFILINEAHHVWTEQYVKERLLLSDKQLRARLTDKDQVFDNYKALFEKQSGQDAPEASALLAGMQTRFDNLNEYVTTQAQKMGIITPELRVGDINSPAAVVPSREGTNYLIISHTELFKGILSDAHLDVLKTFIDHELVHIKNGDISPAGVASTRTPEASQRREMLADMGTQNPRRSTEWAKDALIDTIPAYNKAHPDKAISASHLGIEELKRVSDWAAQEIDPVHPPLLATKAAGEIHTALSVALEQNAARYGRTVTPEDRNGQLEWINERIMQQFTAGQLPDPASLKSPLQLTPAQIMQITGMDPIPMAPADKSSAPLVPGTPKGKEAQR